jgi:hypothetical protein
MNKFALAVFLLFVFSAFLGAKPKAITIVESTIRVESQKDQQLYYGFCAGDQIEINLEVQNGEFISEFEISELPSTTRFSELNIKKIRNKVLTVGRTGIYRFRLSNSSPVFQHCKLIINRIPVSDSTANFNSSIYWRTVQDTTYTPVEEKYIIKSDTLVQEVYSGNPQVGSRYAISANKNYQIIDFQLPENTILWSFFIGTGTQAKEVFKNARTKFALNAASVISHIPEYGPMAALALTGVSYFSNMKGEDNVKYWFLPDGKSVLEFQTHGKFQFYKRGDVTIEAAQMRWPLKGFVHLAVMNDNSFETIDLTIKVTAIHLRQRWGTRIIKALKVTNREEPFLKK